MIEEDLHKEIKNRLEYFHSVKKIPNIIFHGPNGSGKRWSSENGQLLQKNSISTGAAVPPAGSQRQS